MRQRATPSMRTTWLVFLGLFLYLACVGAVGQPAVHPFYDEIMVRDCGTVWSSLTWNPADQKHFLPVAVMRHLEGPLQFLVLNVYYHLVGNLVPLNPTTGQFPNTVFMFLSALVAYQLGRALFSERAGLLAALLFALMPWLAVVMRRPELFNSLSCLLTLTTLWCYVRFVLEPGNRRYRIAAPAALAGYLLTGLDWPIVLPVLALFLGLNRRLRAALINPWNALPAAVILGYVIWTAAVWYYGAFISPSHARLYQETILLRPFVKVGTTRGEFASLSTILINARDSFWLALPLALVGIGGWLIERRRRVQAEWRPHAAVGNRLMAAVAVWFALGAVPLFKASSALTYGYVVGVPMALLAARALWRWRMPVVVLVGVAMAAFQWHIILRDSRFGSDDRRVLAAAAFLIEQRPDLLTRERVAFLPRNDASNVGQYARGQNTRIIMPLNFPVELNVGSVASDEAVLREFVDAYNLHGRIQADWLILSSEAVAPAMKAAEFYRRLLADPQISWIAKFADRNGRALWLGEVKPGGAPLGQVAVYPVGPLADRYAQRYDRIRFLQKNVTYVIHSFP